VLGLLSVDPIRFISRELSVPLLSGVGALLPGAATGLGFAVCAPGKKYAVERPVRVLAGPVGLDGDLATPAAAQGVILFAHGSGSGRHSPRNRQVASALGRAGFATLLLDLLTLQEEAADRASGHLRFDVELLAGRLLAAADWLAAEQRTAGLPVGLFGASTGAGAALLAAAERPQAVAAVVSRGGRPDLAGAALGRVLAPTLLIVGALDPQVLELNRAALGRLGSEASLEVVPGASHLFEEPGTLERVAELAVGWFTRWLAT
jgi:putative phosphoribosyl transferase